jgi:hypothetical protein
MFSATGEDFDGTLMQAIQISDGVEHAPLLPADRMQEVSYEMDKSSARSMNNFFGSEHKSKFKKRKFVVGATYEKLFAGFCEIDHQVDGDVNIEVDDTSSGTRTVIKIRSAAAHSDLLSSIVELGDTMPRTGNCRRKVGDVGDMFGLGYRSKRTQTIYVQTANKKTAAAMAAVSSGVAAYMTENYNDVLDSILLAEKNGVEVAPPLAAMGGDGGPGGTIMISRDLGNSSHFDTADRSHSFAIWVERHDGRAGNWYFILPNLSINGSDGVVIKLRHGVAISWDGRIIRHCSSVTTVGEDNHVYGCMFGSCRD